MSLFSLTSVSSELLHVWPRCCSRLIIGNQSTDLQHGRRLSTLLPPTLPSNGEIGDFQPIRNKIQENSTQPEVIFRKLLANQNQEKGYFQPIRSNRQATYSQPEASARILLAIPIRITMQATSSQPDPQARRLLAKQNQYVGDFSMSQETSSQSAEIRRLLEFLPIKAIRS